MIMPKKKKHWSGLISESIFNVWCLKNSHQTGAIKPLLAKKKKGEERDRLWVPHPIPSTHLPPIKEAWRSLLIQSVSGRYLQFVLGSSWDSHMGEGNAVSWWSPALHNPQKAPECLHMMAKSWPGSVGASQSEEHSATGNVKPRKPQGDFC